MIKKTAFLLAVILAAKFALNIVPVYAYQAGWYFEYKINLQNPLVLKGTSTKEQFGSSLAKGDFNADGKDDIAVGSPYFSDGKKFRGKVSIFLNKGNNFNAEEPDIIILGENKNHYFGVSVAFGDFNGDGIDDLAVGSMNGDKIWMFFGKKTGISQTETKIIDLSKDPADITFKTAELNENFGFSIDMADINGDGIKDLIIGAPSANQTGKIRSGKIYVVFGYKFPQPQFVYDFSKIQPSMIIWGENALDKFGSSITHGDINGDKRIDIIAGAYLSGKKFYPQIGKVYVFFGINPSDLSPYVKKPVEIRTPDITIDGPGARSWFGYSIDAKDINGDGLSDIAIGSFTYQSETKTGKAHIYYGNKTDFKTIKSINSTDSFTIINEDKYEDIMGSSVDIADMNNDNKSDFIIGAPGIREGSSSSPGHVYVFDGQNLKNKKPILVIEGARQNDWFGSVVLDADFNGDGYSDFVISAPNAYNSGKREGAVYIIFGGNEWPGKYRYKNLPPESPLTRAELVYEIVQEFDMSVKNKDFLRQCWINPEFCLNKLVKNATEKKIKFSPNITIYQDVSANNIFYKEITEAAMLGVIKGINEKDKSLFKPDEYIERIYALRVLLESSGMITWEDKQEIKNQKTPFKDINAADPNLWWWPRYVNYAYLSGIITNENIFRPYDAIKQGELEEWIAAIKRITE